MRKIKQQPNGVYFIAVGGNNHKTYTVMTDETTTAPVDTRYIGVKMGDRAIAVALKDLPSAWLVNFSHGPTIYTYKCYSYAVRAVAAF